MVQVIFQVLLVETNFDPLGANYVDTWPSQQEAQDQEGRPGRSFWKTTVALDQHVLVEGAFALQGEWSGRLVKKVLSEEICGPWSTIRSYWGEIELISSLRSIEFELVSNYMFHWQNAQPNGEWQLLSGHPWTSTIHTQRLPFSWKKIFAGFQIDFEWWTLTDTFFFKSTPFWWLIATDSWNQTKTRKKNGVGFWGGGSSSRFLKYSL